MILFVKLVINLLVLIMLGVVLILLVLGCNWIVFNFKDVVKVC